MKKLLLCMFTLVLLASTKLMAAKENKFYNITVDGKARKYLLYVPTQSGSYKKSIYEAGEGGFPVIFYEIDGMGHEAFTNKTEDSSSSQTMWNFFKQYTLDSPCDTTLKWMPRIETEGYEPKKQSVILGDILACHLLTVYRRLISGPFAEELILDAAGLDSLDHLDS